MEGRWLVYALSVNQCVNVTKQKVKYETGESSNCCLYKNVAILLQITQLCPIPPHLLIATPIWSYFYDTTTTRLARWDFYVFSSWRWSRGDLKNCANFQIRIENEEYMRNVTRWLCTTPNNTTYRVNTLKFAREHVAELMQREFGNGEVKLSIYFCCWIFIRNEM